MCRCDWFGFLVHGRFHDTYDVPLEGHLRNHRFHSLWVMSCPCGCQTLQEACNTVRAEWEVGWPWHTPGEPIQFAPTCDHRGLRVPRATSIRVDMCIVLRPLDGLPVSGLICASHSSHSKPESLHVIHLGAEPLDMTLPVCGLNVWPAKWAGVGAHGATMSGRPSP